MHNNHNGKNIHNIAVVGKDGSGKTLFVNTLLKMNNKNPVEVTIQPEEESRGFTIYNRFFHFDDGDVAINLIDTPGSTDFLASVKASLFPCTGAVYVASALEGTGGGMRVWERIVINNTPRSVFVNMMDMPEANFEKTIQSIEASFVLKSIPLSIPWFEDGKLVGVIDVINRKLLRGDSGKTKAEDLPVDAVDVTELHRSTTYERLAELDDELMEYYIEEKDAPYELLIKVLTAGVKSCEITPVFAGSAALNIGIGVLYDFIKINYPAHGQGKTFEARKGRAEDTEPVERKLDAS
ncbi:50S ribosome-binding GTPase, partial [bacterium]|nr:50S ribosome-binding GTPase [bacterium]